MEMERASNYMDKKSSKSKRFGYVHSSFVRKDRQNLNKFTVYISPSDFEVNICRPREAPQVTEDSKHEDMI